MASRAVTGQLLRTLGRARGGYRTTAAMQEKVLGSVSSEFAAAPNTKPRGVKKGDYVPLCMALGLIALSVGFGLYTADLQLAHSPSVYVRKDKRESVPEVTDPDTVVDEAERLVHKSVFRKVAHVQDFDKVRAGTTDPVRGDPFVKPKKVETLKSVGIDPTPQPAGH